MAPQISFEPWRWLSSMQNLCAITLEEYFLRRTTFQASIHTLHLPHLHTLQFADNGHAMAQSVSTWHLPSLRNLIFTETNSNSAFNCILKSHGHKIEKFVFTRDLEVDESMVDTELSPPSLPQLRFLSMPFSEPHDLPSVTPLITSPNLENVEFPVDITSLMPYGGGPYHRYTLGEGSVGELIDMLLNREKTPSLRTIRFLNLSQSRPILIDYWLEELKERLWERGVRLQIDVVDCGS